MRDIALSVAPFDFASASGVRAEPSATALPNSSRRLRQGDRGALRVAASPVQIEAILTTFLHRYTEKYSLVTVKLIEAVGPNIRTMLERGDIHVGLLGRLTAAT